MMIDVPLDKDSLKFLKEGNTISRQFYVNGESVIVNVRLLKEVK